MIHPAQVVCGALVRCLSRKLGLLRSNASEPKPGGKAGSLTAPPRIKGLGSLLGQNKPG